MQREADLFKALSDSTRLRLAVLLAIRGETCVCDLAAALAEPDFKISRHLGVLRAAGLVGTRREGTWMYYRVAAARNDLEQHLQNSFRNDFAGHPTVREDLDRLQEAADRRAREARAAISSTSNMGPSECAGESRGA
jgi:DNA-binding transcriptional ArsR family regulator